MYGYNLLELGLTITSQEKECFRVLMGLHYTDKVWVII